MKMKDLKGFTLIELLVVIDSVMGATKAGPNTGMISTAMSRSSGDIMEQV